MADPKSPEPGGRSRLPWGRFFQESSAAVFVVSGERKLRYANPAWERLTGQQLARLRGTRFSTARQSSSPLWKALAPPAEVWDGQVAQVRRPAPPAETGPPWWDVTFVPLPGEGGLVGVLGVIDLVGRAQPRSSAYKIPAVIGELRHLHAAAYPFDLFEGTSPGARKLLMQARLASQTAVPAWLIGEPGTGKETLARVIHHHGPTRERAFVGLDCRGLQPYLVESLLTGRGGLLGFDQVGTLYLKEPAALPRDLQERVASPFVDAKPDGPRLICGSTESAASLVRDGQLVPVFLTSLSVLEITLPPLRTRLDELPRLADGLLDRIPAASRGKVAIAEDVFTVLRSHSWPGNVRELMAVLTAAVARAGDGPVQVEHLPRYFREKHTLAQTGPAKPVRPPTLDEVLEQVERRLIEHTLRQAGNSQTEAAERLGIFRTRLWRRMEALGIPAPPRPTRPRTVKDEPPEA